MGQNERNFVNLLHCVRVGLVLSKYIIARDGGQRGNETLMGNTLLHGQIFALVADYCDVGWILLTFECTWSCREYYVMIFSKLELGWVWFDGG